MREKKAVESPNVLRIIKKYANRRLYDTNSSAYITLSDVKQLVMDGQDFLIEDAKTGVDLTRSTLMHIILEEETGDAPIFTAPVLKNMIRFYGHSIQGFAGTYLEKNVQSLTDFQANFSDKTKGFSPEMLTKLLSLQPSFFQSMLQGNIEQSNQLLNQVQETMHNQAEQILGVFRFQK